MHFEVGTVDQTLLQPAGDDTRIDWGYLYAAAPARIPRLSSGRRRRCSSGFVAQGTLPSQNDARMPRAASDSQPVLAFVFDLGQVDAKTGLASPHRRL